jgi:DNA polymerase-4
MTAVRTILHCDLDAFYASVEQLDHPEYRGLPVIVGGSARDRGVVAAASYEARAFGVQSAMPLRVAARLCPHGIFVPGNHERYAELSDRVMALFLEYTPLVEPLSLDEAFLDVTGSARLFGDGNRIARALKERVRGEIGIVLSVGVASNKLCAKIASDLGKPDGLVNVRPGHESAFLAPLPLRRLWGIGPRMQEALEQLGYRTVGDLAQADRSALESRFGVMGAVLIERAAGTDVDTVRPARAAKSIGAERTFDQDQRDDARVEATLLRLSEGVGSRLRASEMRGSCVMLKLRLAPFVTHTRQRTLAEPTDDDRLIYRTARDLYRRERKSDATPVRLIGVSISRLEDAKVGRQLGLFVDERATRLHAAVDTVRARHGDSAIERASVREGDRMRRISDHRRGAPVDKPVDERTETVDESVENLVDEDG